MAAALARLWGRLGWRGLALLTTGVSWISYGASLTIQPRYGTVRGISVLLDLMCMAAWGWLWITAGAISLAYALVRPGRDLLGVAAAMGPPLLWSLAYALGAMAGTSPTAWGAIAPWASHALLIAIVAYLTRPRLIVPRVVGDGAQ
ncbi:hypothetical protein OOK29_26155 [Streptomyces phaeochromogenes]|uniref:hypothetical protein n=1 Tax=Streptomyces phaeochromogenes TaxID=1923 RepID=UPI00224FE59E|nr:hypothetical protein [Streptomyces phaeochromogenes]MCX5601639.1 hypothetical protein [Streptomyces phaeochromogenes]